MIVVGEAGLPATAQEAGEQLGVDLDRLLEAQRGTGFSPTPSPGAGATAAYPLLTGEVAEVLIPAVGAWPVCQVVSRRAPARVAEGVLELVPQA